MRILVLVVFFNCLLCSDAWSQLGTYPLSWQTVNHSNARTQAVTPYTTTLKLPYFYDFSSKYLHIEKITYGVSTPVEVYTLRPHGLIDGDSIYVEGARSPTDTIKFNGVKYIDTISNYAFRMYENKTRSLATVSDTTIDYLRISKVGAKVSITPDTLAFYYNQGGVQINGGAAKNQPSYYVASFDGLNEYGTPYSSNTLAVGYTDSLRSQPFDFSTYTAASSIYMSFYYQHGGYGEAPDANDHLYLEFLDNTNNWNVVNDVIGGGGNDTTFYPAIVPISDPKYFHNKFQYRFRSYGRQSGAYDVWNIDYLYIKKNRSASDTLIYDFAIQNGDNTFLKKYSSMPFNHFFSYTDTTHYKNVFRSVVTNQRVTGKLKGMEVEIKDQFNQQIGFQRTKTDQAQLKLKSYSDTLSSLIFPTRNKPMYVDLTYKLIDNQRTDVSTDAFELMFNNAITKRTFLYDYYAYDDSEAEVAFGTNVSGTQIAYKYTAEIKDALTHIDICFARSKGPNLEGSQIYLMVWKNSLTEANVIYKEAISIHYQDYANGFTRYELNTPITLDSLTDYYIGYEQNLSSLLTLGYDRNIDSRSKTYYKESSTWLAMSADPTIDSGSIMMRPVYYKASNNVPTGVKNSDVNKGGLLLYPNPASTTVDIITTEKVSDLTYTLYSLYGQVVANGTITSTHHTIDVSQLSTGMYLVMCTDSEGKLYSTRFIKE